MQIIQSVFPALPYIQIILSVLLIAAILLQQRGSSLGEPLVAITSVRHFTSAEAPSFFSSSSLQV
jgi:preprotein translocase subunit SecG